MTDVLRVEDLSKVKRVGKLTLVLGCMFAAKTNELLRIYHRSQYAKKRCFLIKPSKDNRYSMTDIVTHDKRSIQARACVNLMEIIDEAENYDYILIDEGQFFTDIVEACEISLDMDKIIYVAALRSDFRRHPFPVVSELIARANGGIICLTAVCPRCGDDATETKLIASVDIKADSSEYIGGAESYVPLCLSCWKHM